MSKDVMGFAATQLLWGGVGRSVFDDFLTRIEADRDHYALEQKALRERDRLRTLAQSPLLPITLPDAQEAPPLSLQVGRPRTSAQWCSCSWCCAASWAGGWRTRTLYALLSDSITRRAYMRLAEEG